MQIYQRGDNENWSVQQFLSLEDQVKFASINCIVKVSDIYKNVDLPAPATEDNPE